MTPRPLSDFRLLTEELTPTPSDQAATPIAASPAVTGQPVTDRHIIAAVTTTVRRQVACLNAGDFARVTALYSDEAFLRSFSGPGADASDEVLESLLAPSPVPPDQRLHLPSIENIRLLPDGRVTAEIVSTTASITSELRQRAAFVPSDGGYLIDRVTTVSRSDATAATPTP